MPAIFFARYRVNGKLTRKKIGEYPDISINEARILALECYDYFKHAQLPTFKEAKELFIKKKQQENHPCKYITNIRNLLSHMSMLDSFRIDEITPKVVIEKFSEDTSMTPTIKFKSVQILKQILNYCVLIYDGYSHNKILSLVNSPENPFKTPHSKGLPYCSPSKLQQVFFQKLKVLEIPKRALILFIALTALRITSATQVRWSWIDFAEKKIIIPAEFMKMRVEHVVPITPILERFLKNWCTRFPPVNDFVFPSNTKQNSAVHPSHLQILIGGICHRKISAHVFSKVCATYLAEKGVDWRIHEAILAHDVKRKVESIYNKYDYFKEKLAATEIWHEFVVKGLPEEFKLLLNDLPENK